MGLRRDRDNPRPGRPRKPVEQQIGQQEGREMVDREGQLVTIGRNRVARRDQPGIIDQHVEPLVPRPYLGGEGAHRVEAGKIGDRGFELGARHALGDKAARRLGALGIAPDHDDPHPRAREAKRRMASNSGARPGDDGDFCAVTGHRRE